jgi:predicted amidophosphoribosyltransferase
MEERRISPERKLGFFGQLISWYREYRAAVRVREWQGLCQMCEAKAVSGERYCAECAADSMAAP